MGGFASVTEEDGVLARSAEANGLRLADVRFPPGYVQPRFEPNVPYLAVVLGGGLEKTFRLRTMRLAHSAAVSMPVGAGHGARFGEDGARVVIVRPEDGWYAAKPCLDRLVELRGSGYSWLAWRLAGELTASDEAAPLAAEGFALELLAAAARESRRERTRGPAPRWLSAAEELLRAREPLGVRAVADAVGVHPAHLARVFRARHGVSVGEYARRVRLEWAARQLARTAMPLAAVATEAGFADQSHFTRLFKRHLGVTPGRYRVETQRDSRADA